MAKKSISILENILTIPEFLLNTWIENVRFSDEHFKLKSFNKKRELYFLRKETLLKTFVKNSKTSERISNKIY